MKSFGVKGVAVMLTVLSIAAVLVFNHVYMNGKIDEVGDRLALLRDQRASALERFFQTAEAEISFWSLSPDLLELQADMTEWWQAEVNAGTEPGTQLQQLYINDNPHPLSSRHLLADAGDDSRYSEMHAQLHPLAEEFVSKRGYYDLFIINRRGDIMYTVIKEQDYATNLRTGEYSDTALAQVFQLAMEQEKSSGVVISDMGAYSPSAGAPAIFMAKAMHSAAGDFIGVFALQLPTSKITEIMNFTAGMAETGETYLVGEDYLMRSDSRFQESSSILDIAVRTRPAELGLSGETGIQFSPDYRGVEVLSAYRQLPFQNFNWALLAEIDRAEIREIAVAERPAIGRFMLAIYTLSLFSLWWGSRELDNDGAESIDLDFELDATPSTIDNNT